jgi:hypothetical protein
MTGALLPHALVRGCLMSAARMTGRWLKGARMNRGSVGSGRRAALSDRAIAWTGGHTAPMLVPVRATNHH